MSEAPFLFFLVVTSRYLARWIGTANVSALVVAALGLALAYLTRYEAAAAAGAASLLVLSVSAFRTTGDRRSRLLAGLADALIIAVPFAAVFIGWALASWIIVGSPFETFTSIYGNSSQVGLAARYIRESTGQGTAAGAGYVASQLFGLEPLLLPCAAIALVTGLVRRDLRILAPLAVMCAVLGFAAWAFLDGKSFGWLRFYIAAIPLMVIVCGSLLANSAVAPTRRRGRLRFASRLTVAALLTSIALLGSGVAVIWGGRTMLTPNLGREENGQVAAAIGGGALARAISPEVRLYDLAGTVAANLDRRHLARGSVLVDVATGFPVVLRSNDPTQFVITPDRDFEAAVADPTSFGVEYLLVPGGGSAVLDAISRAHPGVYADGGGIGELVGDFSDGTGAGGWRLYRLIR